MEPAPQIYKRFPFDSSAMVSLKALSPKIVMDRGIPSLVDLMISFGHSIELDAQNIDTE